MTKFNHEFDDVSRIDFMNDDELAKHFTHQIMENVVKDQIKDYQTCYEHVYKVALAAKCAIIFKKVPGNFK